MENPPKKFFRLSPGNEVRLRYAYFIKCTGVIKNAAGEVVELRCTYDPATKGGNAPDGRKVKATMHWLSAAQSVPAEIRVYNQLFANPSPDASNFAADLNPQSLEMLDRRADRACDRREQFDRGDTVRTAGLFRARQGFVARQAGVQPHHRPARHLCQGSRREGLRVEVGRVDFCLNWIIRCSSAADEIVSAIIGKWSAAFSKLDAARWRRCTRSNAFFFGSNPTLYRGQDGVKAYFDGLPRWNSPTVQFTDVRTAQVAADLINVAGTATFVVDEEPSRCW